MSDRITIGNVEILCLSDQAMAFPLPLTTLFPTTSDADWPPLRQRYPDTFDAAGQLHVHFGCYLVRSAGRTLLADTGLGPEPVALFGGVTGNLPDELVRTQVDPDSIDTVFHTHLHFDHVGWSVAGDRTPRFRNARYACSATDWQFFQSPDQAVNSPGFFEQRLRPLQDADVLDLLDGEQALTPEITAIPSPGHTPGHMSLLISSGGEKALITGDAIVHPAQIEAPEWTFLSEVDPGQAVTTRHHLLDRIEAEGMKIVACHFPGPGFGHVVRLEGRRWWQGAGTAS